MLDDEPVKAWLTAHVGSCRDDIAGKLDRDTILKRFEARCTQLREAAVPGSTTDVLTWFSGRDLAGMLALQLALPGSVNGGKDVVLRIRDWVIDHAADARNLFPDFAAVRQALDDAP
jgi:hypothetical protein